MIDVLTPLERGGRAGLFGGAGVGMILIFVNPFWNTVINLVGQIGG